MHVIQIIQQRPTSSLETFVAEQDINEEAVTEFVKILEEHFYMVIT
jgi:hypothetical protein